MKETMNGTKLTQNVFNNLNFLSFTVCLFLSNHCVCYNKNTHKFLFYFLKHGPDSLYRQGWSQTPDFHASQVLELQV